MLLHLDPATSSVAPGRHWVVQQARGTGMDPAKIAAVALLATELITNAILHGSRGQPVTVRITVTADRFTVTVADHSTERPVVSRPPPTAEGGRGVALIDLLADSWGYRVTSGRGKDVWFDVLL